MLRFGGIACPAEQVGAQLTQGIQSCRRTRANPFLLAIDPRTWRAVGFTFAHRARQRDRGRTEGRGEALQRFGEFRGDHPDLAALTFGDLGQHLQVLVCQQIGVGTPLVDG